MRHLIVYPHRSAVRNEVQGAISLSRDYAPGLLPGIVHTYGRTRNRYAVPATAHAYARAYALTQDNALEGIRLYFYPQIAQIIGPALHYLQFVREIALTAYCQRHRVGRSRKCGCTFYHFIHDSGYFSFISNL